MPHLVNPFGRMVDIPNQQDYNTYLRTPGWKKPTEDEEREFVKKRYTMIQGMKNRSDAKAGIYMATVSQGGTDGYSIASKCIIRELQRLGETVATHYTDQKIALLFHNPYSILRIESQMRILYTMFESDKIPDDWHDYLEAADMVLVPSRWNQMVFKKSGIDTRVVPLGYDDTVYKPIARPARRENRQNFTFLHYNAFNIRKGFPEVLKAFVKAFDKTEPVRMIFKTTLDHSPLPITKSEYPHIEIINGKKSEREMLEIMERSDCFVFPSRGEGFGITPLEAMATGMPAIVPNAHGITEYFDPNFMYEVKVKETCPGLYQRYKNQDVGNMVVCDVDDLAQKMRYIYEHQDEARQMGLKASEYVKKWTFAETAKKLKSIIDDARMKPLPDRALRNVLTVERA